MFNKNEIKKLFLRIGLLITLFISFKYFFALLNSVNRIPKAIIKKNVNTKQSKLKENKSIEIGTLRSVDKINAYIEEQFFLLSTIEENKNESELLLNTIENNVLKIEQEAMHKNVNNLIDQTKIEEIKENLNIYRQILTQKIV